MSNPTSKQKIKRYTPVLSWGEIEDRADPYVTMDESDQGRYVRWSEVKDLLKTRRRSSRRRSSRQRRL